MDNERVEYIVAPYEADAQLAYLARTNYVSCVITEDSDLIVFGSPCILFKMDRYGNGTEVTWASFAKPQLASGAMNLVDFDHDMLIRMCIL